MTSKLLGIKIDYISIDQVVQTVNKWLQSRGKHSLPVGKHYIVTPNPEMIVDSSFDTKFKAALNEADLGLADSSRLGWGSKLQESKNPIFRLTYMPFFLFPKILTRQNYPTTTGTDLMERLIGLSEEKAYTTAYLGGSKEVAVKLFKCLRQKYPKLKIVFCSGNIEVNKEGDHRFDVDKYRMTMSKNIKFNPHSLTQKIDILFVAFGHIKQEKWINKNLPKLNTRVMVGVGGAFDYLSSSIPRAPQVLRSLDFEWVFRLAVQPWRIKRFWKLGYFLYMVMTRK